MFQLKGGEGMELNLVMRTPILFKQKKIVRISW